MSKGQKKRPTKEGEENWLAYRRANDNQRILAETEGSLFPGGEKDIRSEISK